MSTFADQTAAMRQATQRFVDTWGDMASAWGISRTMAQVYALLYASPEPMDTDTVMHVLEISRGNANMNLRKLVEWELIRKVEDPEHQSRKEHFMAEKDVWNLTSRVIRERAEKEIKPVASYLGQIGRQLNEAAETEERPLTPAEKEFQKNLASMGSFLTLFNTLTDRVLPLLESKNQKQLETILKLLPSHGKKHPETH